MGVIERGLIYYNSVMKPRTSAISWDECFMKIAAVIAQRSKDPSTQAGAVICDPEHVVLGLGYNGWPRGIDQDRFPWERDGDYLDTKYPYVCHAELNAVLNSNASLKGATLYCTLFPCNECAKVIIQKGITEVVYDSDKHNQVPAFQAGRRLLEAAQVKMREYKHE